MMEEESITIAIGPSTMQERVRNAAENGDVDALYELIREKPDFLKEMDEMEFVDTPLHIAAAAGRAEFTLELMDLKPSFASKVNQDGLSPLHLAVQNEHTDTVLSLMRFDNNLVRVKGKKGYTPFHYAVMKGDLRVLGKFLKHCPQCILDVTNRKETALHLAAGDNNFEVLLLLVQALWGSNSISRKQFTKILNLKNIDGNNVLHIAASNNQPNPKIFSVLIRSGINTEATNSENSTAFAILKGRNQEEDRRRQILKNYAFAVWSKPISFIPLICQLAYEIRNMPGDRSNALLVVTVLILTATYQATLSPPGGVFQANSENTTHSNIHLGSSFNITKIFKKDPFTAGSSVLHTAPFLGFFIPNILAFSISFLLTCLVLICILPAVFSVAIVLSMSMLLVCLLLSAVLIISPNSQSFLYMSGYVSLLVPLFVLLFYIIFILALPKILSRRRSLRSNKTQFLWSSLLQRPKAFFNVLYFYWAHRKI